MNNASTLLLSLAALVTAVAYFLNAIARGRKVVEKLARSKKKHQYCCIAIPT